MSGSLRDLVAVAVIHPGMVLARHTHRLLGSQIAPESRGGSRGIEVWQAMQGRDHVFRSKGKHLPLRGGVRTRKRENFLVRRIKECRHVDQGGECGSGLWSRQISFATRNS